MFGLVRANENKRFFELTEPDVVHCFLDRWKDKLSGVAKSIYNVQ